jgi:glycosyltransferase involved in cell wall biosynthesis
MINEGAKSQKQLEPSVSIIINCFNGEKYLAEAIDSVLSQTYSNWEIIFWDNQSSDESAAVFERYQDDRLKYFYSPQHTLLYEARNYAIAKASHDLIAFLDVDDLWLPDKLEKQIALFTDPTVGFVCGNYLINSERKSKSWRAFRSPIPSGWVLDDLLKFYFIGLVTLVVRRSALESLDYPFNSRFHIIGDLDLCVRLSFHWKLGCVQEPVAVYRLHGGNESSRHRDLHADELELWAQEMKDLEAIRMCRNSRFIKCNFVYIKAFNYVLQGKKSAAYKLLQDLPWGLLKFRLWISLFLPIAIVRRIKN